MTGFYVPRGRPVNGKSARNESQTIPLTDAPVLARGGKRADNYVHGGA
jgi:hypothetical protein